MLKLHEGNTLYNNIMDSFNKIQIPDTHKIIKLCSKIYKKICMYVCFSCFCFSVSKIPWHAENAL